MKSSGAGSIDAFALSRPVKPGRKIDFFMSHSWHDDPNAKWQALVRIVGRFKAVYNRDPTFWLDKACIDQANIRDGLKVLPINIMSARRVLVLWGPTYPKRLWCIWEL